MLDFGEHCIGLCVLRGYVLSGSLLIAGSISWELGEQKSRNSVTAAIGASICESTCPPQRVGGFSLLLGSKKLTRWLDVFDLFFLVFLCRKVWHKAKDSLQFPTKPNRVPSYPNSRKHHCVTWFNPYRSNFPRRFGKGKRVLGICAMWTTVMLKNIVLFNCFTSWISNWCSWTDSLFVNSFLTDFVKKISFAQ